MESSNQNILFPLSSLIQRLELAGFYISPAQRLQLLRVLELSGKQHFAAPEKLKYLLCPIIAQSVASQQRFHELFDQWWEQVKQPWPMPEASAAVSRWQWAPVWLRWALAGGMVALAAWSVWKMIEPADVRPLKVFFQHPAEVRLGDTLHVENLSENCDSSSFRWEITDTSTRKAEPLDNQSFHLHFLVKNAGENPWRKITLTSTAKTGPLAGQPLSHTSEFRILCARPPVIDTIVAPAEAETGTPVRFETRLPDTADVVLAWHFGDAETGYSNQGTPPIFTQKTTTHTFQKEGFYEVRLTATRTGLDGDCTVEKIHRISIGQEKAYLAALPLRLDVVKPSVHFSWLTYLIAGVLALAMGWHWLRWVRRKAPLPANAAAQDLEKTAETFRAADRAPYFIPFQAQESHLRVERELFRFADVLRLRQEGLRREFDVPASVRRTIAEGGFPHLLTRTDTVPTEYLFLLDEQPPGSHLRRLLEWLTGFLRQRDVLGEVFFFNASLHSFWNERYPAGLSPEQLRRQYPWHRLLVLADGHSLLDPHPAGAAGAKPTLRPDAVQFFKTWKNRLLLTPMPVASWTYREGALHEMFAIFPIHTDGLTEAAKHLERGITDEERSTYAAWSERLREGRAEPDVNYRRWRTAADHEEYLDDHPDLFTWVCALAVYPKPDWSITLAIGRALSSFGVELTYDNLLIISRIPWLQTGDLPTRLRKELLEELEPEAEKLARQAVQAELEAVQELVKNSQINHELQLNLSLQNFALAPESPETQTAIRSLLALDLITPKQRAELNQTVERHVRQEERLNENSYGNNMGPRKKAMQKTMQQAARTAVQAPDIQEFLKKDEPAMPQPLPKPFFTRNFFKAAASTVVFILLMTFVGRYEASDELARWSGQHLKPSSDCQAEQLFFSFLKKECWTDSAALFNNSAVHLWNQMPGDTTILTPTIARQANQSTYQTVVSNLEKAIRIKPGYTLAITNQLRVVFNSAVQHYHTVLADSADAGRLRLAMLGFETAAGSDSLRLNAWHGLGLCHYELEKESSKAPDSSQLFYEKVLGADSLFFDTLKSYPNLQSLLTRSRPPALKTMSVQVVDSVTEKPLPGVLAICTNVRTQTDKDGWLTLEIGEGASVRLLLSKKGYDSRRIPLTWDAANTVQKLGLYPTKPVKATPKKTPDSDGDGIPDDLDKCPKERGVKSNAGCPPPEEKKDGKVPIGSDPNYKESPTQQNPPPDSQRLETPAQTGPPPEPDSDGDGVPDAEDKCPKEKGDAKNGGCPG